MDKFQIIGLLILIVFYGIYIGKMIKQKRKGIETNQIGKGNKSKKVLITEMIMKLATYGILVVEVICIIMNQSALPIPIVIIGMLLAMMGDVAFGLAVWTMRDSWRAGIPEKDKTTIVTKGIYRFSRNPAFLGFDFVYIGTLLMFFHPVHFVVSIFAIIMLHLQILQEEAFLPTVFGEEYHQYKKTVKRYLGRYKE